MNQAVDRFKASFLARAKVPRAGLFSRNAVLLALAVTPELAVSDSLYDMEMVVFLRNPEHVVTVEKYSPAQAAVLPNRFWTFALDGLPGENTLQSSGIDRLSGAAKRIERSPGYQVLFSAGWTQPVSNGENSIPLLIQAHERAPGIYQLEGTVNVTFNSFLHAQFDLRYSDLAQLPAVQQTPSELDPVSSESTLVSVPGTDSSTDTALVRQSSDGLTRWQTTKSFHMNTERRLRTDELLYVDHPYLGVLLYAKAADVAVEGALDTKASAELTAKTPAETPDTPQNDEDASADTEEFTD